MSERCQLQAMPGAGREEVWLEKLHTRFRKVVGYVSRRVRKALANPSLVIDKISRCLRDRSGKPTEEATSADETRVTPTVLGLSPGERVRVKSFEGIRQTLDAAGRCGGLSFMPSVMTKFCGGTYTVQKRINRFFDERRWRFFRLRDVVILNSVFCESPVDGEEDWAGCDRTCFLFWKEAWLERIREDERD